MAADKLANREPYPLGPYADAVVPTQNDAVDDPAGPCAALVCTGAGNVKVTLISGTTLTIAITAGWDGRLLMRIKRVWSTSTTATGLLFLYL